jgi:hypothetical protein
LAQPELVRSVIGPALPASPVHPLAAIFSHFVMDLISDCQPSLLFPERNAPLLAELFRLPSASATEIGRRFTKVRSIQNIPRKLSAGCSATRCLVLAGPAPSSTRFLRPHNPLPLFHLTRRSPRLADATIRNGLLRHRLTSPRSTNCRSWLHRASIPRWLGRARRSRRSARIRL